MTAAKLPTCCQYHADVIPDGCNQGRACPARPVTAPGETVALGVEAALPQSFSQAKAPADWETVLICGAVVVTFTAVMALSVYKG